MPIFGMEDKVSVITGSSKGIGRAIAIALAKSKEYSGIVTNARKGKQYLGSAFVA